MQCTKCSFIFFLFYFHLCPSRAACGHTGFTSLHFPESSIGTIGKTWLQTRSNGWWRWTNLRNFVQRSRVLFTPVFALVRALKRAALSACEPLLRLKGVSIVHRLRYFDKVVSPVACFGASHRTIHEDDLAKLDVEYRRLMRMVVGPPADTNSASPWHDILHGWNSRVQILSDHAGLQPWSVTCIEAVWKFASYVAILPPERWTRRILAWNMKGPRKRGRPAYTWETALQKYSIWKGFDNWIVEAAARESWMLMKRDFVVFTLHNR